MPSIFKQHAFDFHYSYHLLLYCRDCCKDAACQSDVTWHSREICHGSDSRVVRLPSNLNQDAVKCSYKDGVLCVAFPKVESHGGMKKLLITS